MGLGIPGHGGGHVSQVPARPELRPKGTLPLSAATATSLRADPSGPWSTWRGQQRLRDGDCYWA